MGSHSNSIHESVSSGEHAANKVARRVYAEYQKLDYLGQEAFVLALRAYGIDTDTQQLMTKGNPDNSCTPTC
jgi:hypothetical protein